MRRLLGELHQVAPTSFGELLPLLRLDAEDDEKVFRIYKKIRKTGEANSARGFILPRGRFILSSVR